MTEESSDSTGGPSIVWDDGTENGVPITAENSKVLPGHCVQLKIKADTSPTDIEWSFDDTPEGGLFHDYITDHDSGIVEPLSGSYRTDPSIRFYWAFSGNYNVSAKFRLAGRLHTRVVPFEVQSVTVTFSDGYNPPAMGSTQIIPNPRPGAALVVAPYLAEEGAGITSFASIDTPEGFSDRLWGYAQVIPEISYTFRIHTDDCAHWVKTNTQLDGHFPYYELEFSTGSGEQRFADMPQIPTSIKLRGMDTYTDFDQIISYASFRVHVMFLPPATDVPGQGSSCWVSLYASEWTWGTSDEPVCCEVPAPGNDMQVYQGGAINVTPWTENTTQPEWTGNAEQKIPVSCDCPGHCSGR